jgi:hypothetical protein
LSNDSNADALRSVADIARPFSLLVTVLGEGRKRFTFNQQKVRVGRGRDCDLRIEHAAMSRAQFLIERGRGSQGEARFRVVPFDSKNPTYLNDRPAVEGTITPGDVLKVGDVRVVLERKIPKTDAPDKPPFRLPPLMRVLLGSLLMVVVWGGLYLWQRRGDDSGGELTVDAKLFVNLPDEACASAAECDERAHDAYTRGRRLMEQASADPGNLYRATLEFHRAVRLGEQAGKPLADIADAPAQMDRAKQGAEAEFRDARFRLSRAIAAQDTKRAREEAVLLSRIVPDDQHPYRIKLDAYRRTLTKEGP